ncbi:MAG: large-conductance mechanosensitive channel protein MscL [Bdellovibrionales bacterium]
MQTLKEFREFAVKGNVVDMAVGVVIGAAFGKVVSSVVGDLIMPPIGLLVGGVDFSQLKIVLKAAVDGQAEVALRYGAFLQTVFDFVIVAWAIFMAVKLINRLKRQPPPAGSTPLPPPPEVQLLTEIRDLLRNK